MNQRISLTATILCLLAVISPATPPSVEASDVPKPPPLKALAGPNFYDFLSVMSPDSSGAAAWYAGLAAGVGRTGGPIKQLLESRLSLLIAKGGSSLEQWQEAAAMQQQDETPGHDDAPAELPTLASTYAQEIQLLSHAASALVQPSEPHWDEAFIPAVCDSVDWQPSFLAFAYVLASDHAIASGRLSLGLEYGVWARIHADSSDRTVLRRAARERILIALSKLGGLDSELAQLAAIQIADRERVAISIRQIAHEALKTDLDVDLSSAKALARRITFDGPEQKTSPNKQIRTRPYLLASLHTLSSPGPATGNRKRLSRLEETIQLAEAHDSELSARLKVPYLSSLLRAQRFNSVMEFASSTFEAANEHELRSLGIEASAIAAIAATQARAPELQHRWQQVARQGIAQLIGQPKEPASTLTPRAVLHELMASKLAKKADRTNSRSIANLSRETTDSPIRVETKATKLSTRLSDKEQRATTRWSLLVITCAAVLGCLGLLVIGNLRRPRNAPIVIDALSHSPPPVALLGPSNGSNSAITPLRISNAKTAGPENGDIGETSKSMTFGASDFRLRQLLRDAIADLQRRDKTSRFELASDSSGDYEQTIFADYSKLRRLVRHLGIATSRVAEGSRIMVGGMLRDGLTDAAITLELSFTYPLPASSELTTASSLGDSWAEDNVLASLVHLLSCNVSHQHENNLGCLLASVPLAATHSSAHDSGHRSEPKDQGVLVVDSDPLALKSIAASLQALGCNCTCGSSLAEARGLLTQSRNYAIIMLDINLSNEDSSLLAQEIKRMPDDIRPVVIAMGNAADTGVGSKAASASFDDLLVKPYTLERLACVVQAARVD